jgi:integrase
VIASSSPLTRTVKCARRNSSSATLSSLAAQKRAARKPRYRHGQRKRNFHSLRHTYARKVLEQGLPISWLSRQLGHSPEAVTDKHFGQWSRARARQETERLSGVFAI